MGKDTSKASAAAAAADASPTTGTDNTTQATATAAPAANESKTNTIDPTVIAGLEKKLQDALEDAKAKGSLADSLKEQLEAEKQKSAELQTDNLKKTSALESTAAVIEGYQLRLKTLFDENQIEKPIYTAEDGTVYVVTVPEFRYQGTVYNSAEVLASNPGLFEELIKAGNSILKKVD